MIKVKRGDATLVDSVHVIAHIVNNIGLWGAGFTAAIDKRFGKEPGKFYRGISVTTGLKLGDVFYYNVENDRVQICNMVAQVGVRTRENQHPLHLEALNICLGKLADYANRGHVASIQMPKIGSGLGGGDWNQIYELIVINLGRLSIPVTIYDLKEIPPQTHQNAFISPFISQKFWVDG